MPNKTDVHPFPLRIKIESLDELRALATRYGISITAMISIVIEHGLEVQRLLDANRALLQVMVADVATKPAVTQRVR
jgi:hypothetical protein